jgi:hypothetical protein
MVLLRIRIHRKSRVFKKTGAEVQELSTSATSAPGPRKRKQNCFLVLALEAQTATAPQSHTPDARKHQEFVNSAAPIATVAQFHRPGSHKSEI